MNVFEIYNFSVIPDINFSEELILSQDVNFIKNEVSEISKTSKYWSSTMDVSKQKRNIQTIYIEKWEVGLVISRNIDLSLLEIADVVILTTKKGKRFNIYDIECNFEKIQGSRNFKVLITFNKSIEDNVIYHLSSDVAGLHKITGIQAVNELNFTVKKPPITFDADIYLYSGASVFKFPKNEITQNIQNNDWFYLHVDSDSYEFLSHFSQCFCYSIDSDFVYFKIVDAPSFTIEKCRVTIDFEPESEVNSRVDLNNLELNISIYSFLFANTNFISNNENELKLKNGTKENSINNNNLVAEFKFWLKNSELWKIKYLYLATEIMLKQKNKEDIFPVFFPEIKKENKDSLIDLHEFTCNIPYSLLNSNLYR